MTDDIRKMVFENLDSAKENGYFAEGEQLHEATAEEVAYDMLCYADDCLGYDVPTLLPHVEEWLKCQKQ